MKKFIKNNWWYIIIFLMFSILSFFFVYSCDDWFWASQEAVELLKNGFKHYNGRFVSNIIIMVLSKSLFLKCIFYGLTMAIFLHLVKNLINRENKILSYLMVILFFFIDLYVLRQGYIWASGAVNYFLSTILLFYIMKLNCEDSFKDLNIYLSIIFGFLSSLILENVSILLFLINIGLIIYSKIIKEKKYNLGFLIGNIAGSFLLFYNMLAFKADIEGRTIHFSGLIERFSEKIVPYYFGESLIIIALMTLLILYHVTKNRIKISKTNYWLFLLTSAAYLIINIFSHFSIENSILNVVVLTIWIIYSFVILVKVSDSKVKIRMIWYFVLMVGYIAPLVFVDSLGPRLLLFPFIIDIMIILEITNLYFSKYFLEMMLMFASIALIFIEMVMYSVYYQKAEKYKTIIIESLEKNAYQIILPNSDWVEQYYCYVPVVEYYEKYYIEFYDIDTDIVDYELIFKF